MTHVLAINPYQPSHEAHGAPERPFRVVPVLAFSFLAAAAFAAALGAYHAGYLHGYHDGNSDRVEKHAIPGPGQPQK